jgi:prepilin-type N-terminal cleavage/methylation domain-containing protein
MKTTIFHGRRGFTIIEVMLAIALSGVVLLGAYYLMSDSVRQNAKADTSNEGWLEAAAAGVQLTAILKNAPRIVPSEDLDVAGDKLYIGIAPLSGAETPAACLSGPNFSALRVTSISLKQPSAALLRMYFSDMAGGTGPLNELRLTYPADLSVERSMFGAKNPAELFLVDADGVNKRRYSVDTVTIHAHTHENPYDPLAALDPANFYNWVGVHLNNPVMATGGIAAAPNPRISFITQSLAYASATSVICVTKPDPAAKLDSTLVEFAGAERHPLINLDHLGAADTKTHLSVEGFRVSFLASQQTARFDALVPFTDLFTNPQGPCVSAVRFEIDIGVRADVRKTTPDSVPVHLARSVLLPNFATGRPVTCP